VAIIGGRIGYSILKKIGKGGKSSYMDGSAFANRSKLEALLGERFWENIQNKTVIDFGCGTGAEAVEMAQRGASRVIGIDIQEGFLEIARRRAIDAGVEQRCEFSTQTTERADVIVAIDSFEHFDDPSAILRTMREVLKPDGCVITSFGPTWYHPLGGHLFSVFPWAHLVFTEKALIRWRSDFKTDNATRFREVAGGLNQMTIRRFERLVEQSPFEFDRLELIPIRTLRRFANRFTREATTAIVRCRLVPRD
jgi:ubiquinone/menaquinone biosynthesis C-methylase UbiE